MKVTKHQAKDGSLHDSARLCEIHNRKLRLAPAIEKFVNDLEMTASGLSVDDRDNPAIYLTDLPTFLTAHAEKLQETITNALIVRKPRKAKVGTQAPAAANDGQAAAA